jgi:hypothetical protein
MAFITTFLEFVIVAPTSASASFAVPFLFSILLFHQEEEETAKRPLILRSRPLSSSLSRAKTAGGCGHDKVGSASVAFGFFTFSKVESAVAKGADCWLAFWFDEQPWGACCCGCLFPIKKCGQPGVSVCPIQSTGGAISEAEKVL